MSVATGGAGHQPSSAYVDNYWRNNAKEENKKDNKGAFIANIIIHCPDFCWWKCIICLEYISDFNCLLPQKSESELRSPISLRHKKIPFVAGTVNSALILCATLSKCYSVIPCSQWILTFCASSSQRARATQSMPTCRVYFIWWSITSPSCANELGLWTDLRIESGKTSKKPFLRLPQVLMSVTQR